MKKDLSIETLRGIAIILMVAGHVVGDNPATGLKVPEGSFFRYVFYVFLFIRMPLFSAISGYIYAGHAIKPGGQVGPFLKRKITRLLVPLFSAVTIFYLFKRITPDVNNPAPEISQLWKSYFLSWFHFWFVQAIFLVFVVIALLEFRGFLLSRNNWLLLNGAAFVAYFFVNTYPDTIWSINKFFFIFPFFLLGMGLNRFGADIRRLNADKIAMVLFGFTFLLQQYLYFKQITLTDPEHKLLLISVGVPGIATLIFLRPLSKPLAALGYYSFVIYLYHVFGTAGSRLFFQSVFGISNTTLLFFTGLLAGLALPVVLQKVFQRNAALNLLLFGQEPKKKIPEQAVIPQLQKVRPAR